MTTPAPPSVVDNLDRWCFAWFEESRAHGLDRTGLWLRARWTPSQVITCSFLDGDPALHARIERVARQWTGPGMANLTLDFRRDTSDTHVRISFQQQGSWSVIGTTCRRVPAGEPTMNFGWLKTDSTDAELERVVLHEFGHALGLVHEHQLPNGGIPWNKPAVYADLESRWSREQIERNVFATIAPEEAALTNLDPTSIMMYPIKKSWTLNGFSSSLNARRGSLWCNTRGVSPQRTTALGKWTESPLLGRKQSILTRRNVWAESLCANVQ